MRLKASDNTAGGNAPGIDATTPATTLNGLNRIKILKVQVCVSALQADMTADLSSLGRYPKL